MTNNQADELLREVLGVLREIKDRLPERTETEVQQNVAMPKSVVVTGEGAGEGANPSTTAKRGPGRPRKNVQEFR